MRIKHVLLLGTLFALSPAMTSCDDEEDISPFVSFGEQETVSVTSLGGVQSFQYKIQDRVTGGEVAAGSEADWLSDIRVEPTSGTISFTAAANYDEAGRTADIVAVYSLNGQELSRNTIAVTQDGCVFAHDHVVEHFTASWMTVGTQEMYSLSLSDKGRTEQGFFQTDAFYYGFTLYGETPEDPYNVTLAPGRYVLKENAVAGEADLASSDYTQIGQEIIEQEHRSFVSGYIDVAQAEGGYTITAVATDNLGEQHRVSYTGPAAVSGLTKLPSISQDEVFTADAASCRFGVGDKEKMHCEMTLSVNEMDPIIGIPMATKSLTTEIFFKYDKDGRLTPGTYHFTVPDPSGLIDGEIGTMYPGRSAGMAGMPDQARGTYLKIYDGWNVAELAYLTSGTLTIEEVGGGYRITTDLTTDDGAHKVQATYEGPLTISGVPGRFSTLTGDYTLNLANALGSGNYFGDVYGNGCTAYTINLNPYDGTTGDGFMVEFVSKSFANYNEPIPDGVFTAAPEDQTALPGQFTQGALNLSNGQIVGTAFVGAYAGGGMVGQVAPATEGTFAINHLGDGRYRMEFDFVDDRGHRWNGEWEGVIMLQDASLDMFPMQQSNLFVKK